MASASENKLQQPGWRIEQAYRPGVLIGNWSEQRYKFERQNFPSNSTHRTDFTRTGDCKPEVDTRRRMTLVNDGVQKDILFSHHGKRYMNNSITTYDQEFNGRRRNVNPRSWDWHRLAWLPETSDHPIVGEGTKWGLHETLKEKWSKAEQLERVGDFHSTYGLSYNGLVRSSVPSATSHRYSSPRKLSSHFHPNNLNKDLWLRDQLPSTSVKPEHSSRENPRETTQNSSQDHLASKQEATQQS